MAVGTTAVLLNDTTADRAARRTAGVRVGEAGNSVLVTNQGATASVFLGGPTVTSSGATIGYELKAGLSISLGVGDPLFAIAAAAGGRVDVLHVGV